MRTTMRRWQVWVSLIAGAWLFVSPWVLGYTAATAGMWSAYILGAVAVLLALWTLTAPDARIGAAGLAVIGALAFVTPWVIGFGGYAAARVDAWIVGAVIAVVSLWALTEGGSRREPRHPKPTA